MILIKNRVLIRVLVLLNEVCICLWIAYQSSVFTLTIHTSLHNIVYISISLIGSQIPSSRSSSFTTEELPRKTFRYAFYEIQSASLLWNSFVPHCNFWNLFPSLTKQTLIAKSSAILGVCLPSIQI